MICEPDVHDAEQEWTKSMARITERKEKKRKKEMKEKKEKEKKK